LVLPAAAAALAACGSSTQPSPTVIAGLDPCVVGSWKSVGVSGTVTSADGSLHIPLSGGAGQQAVIRANGTVALVYDGSDPEKGTGSDGAAYTITNAGQFAAKLRTSGHQATLDVTDTGTATQTISRNGTVLQKSDPQPEQVSTYTCKPHTSFGVTTFGITVSWVPA
jgi:hypothetical protein